MAYRTLLPLIFVAAIGHLPVMGQERPSMPAETKRAEAERTAIKNKLEAALDRNYEEFTADELLVLSLQHSDIAVPELKRRLSEYGRRPRKPFPRNPAVQADALAYVANELAVDALTELCAEKPDLFCSYLQRSLDYAEGRVNPFTLAYRALGNGHSAVQDTVADWVNGLIGFPHFQRRLAEAVFDKYARVPNETEWLQDPIASRLKDKASPALRQNVFRLVQETQIKRQQR